MTKTKITKTAMYDSNTIDNLNRRDRCNLKPISIPIALPAGYRQQQTNSNKTSKSGNNNIKNYNGNDNDDTVSLTPTITPRTITTTTTTTTKTINNHQPTDFVPCPWRIAL